MAHGFPWEECVMDKKDILKIQENIRLIKKIVRGSIALQYREFGRVVTHSDNMWHSSGQRPFTLSRGPIDPSFWWDTRTKREIEYVYTSAMQVVFTSPLHTHRVKMNPLFKWREYATIPILKGDWYDSISQQSHLVYTMLRDSDWKPR